MTLIMVLSADNEKNAFTLDEGRGNKFFYFHVGYDIKIKSRLNLDILGVAKFFNQEEVFETLWSRPFL